jgi:hypothetical protein
MAHELFTNQVIENKMTDLVNTQLDVNALFTRDDSLSTEAGLKKVINKYTYENVGGVEELAKGAKNSKIGKVTFVGNEYEIKRYQQTFDYNDMDVMQDPYILDVATTGAATLMANHMRDTYIAELRKISKEQPYADFTYETVVDALAAIGKEVEAGMFLIMGTDLRAAVRKDPDYKASKLGEILYTGQFGDMAGIPCLFSNLCAEGEAFITTKDAVKLFVKKDGSVEQDRDIETKDNTVVYDRYGVMALVDDTKSIKFVKQGA